MIAERWSAKRWKTPFGAGRETTTGRVRAAAVRSRGARARTDFRRAVSSRTERNFRACTPTFLPAERPGFEARVQKRAVRAVSLSSRSCLNDSLGVAVCAETLAAETVTANTRPSATAAAAKVAGRRERRRTSSEPFMSLPFD